MTVSYYNRTANQAAVNPAVQLQQTLLALTHSPYGDSKLFSNMPETSTKREDLLRPTNPAAQKAVLANKHKVSPRPMSKIKPKALSGNLNGSKVRKLVIKTFFFYLGRHFTSESYKMSILNDIKKFLFVILVLP